MTEEYPEYSKTVYVCEVMEIMDDRDSASASDVDSFSDDSQAGKARGGGSDRSVAKIVTGVPGFINFNKVCELFVYIVTIISLVNQTVRARPVATVLFWLHLGIPNGLGDKW